MRKYIFEKGFTLVEMMVVVAIIAILAGAFLIGLSGFRSSAYDARRLSDLQKVQGYIELYYNRNGSYPDTDTWGEDGLEGELTNTDTGVGISQIPHDPQYKPNTQVHDDYAYRVDTGLQGYVLRATLNDKKNKVLDNDEDGTVFGLDCNDDSGYYCIKF